MAAPRYSNAMAGSSAELSRRLNELLEDAADTSESPEHNPEKLRDESRKTIAFAFVFSFVGIVGAILLLVPLYNAIVFNGVKIIPQEVTYQPLDIEKVLTTVGTILGTPLGFVVGYYFKEEHLAKQHKHKLTHKPSGEDGWQPTQPKN